MPAAKRRRTPRVDKRVALHERLGEIQAEIARLRSDRELVRREEFVEMTKSLHQIQRHADNLEVHSKDRVLQRSKR
jgi:hypothetical protein